MLWWPPAISWPRSTRVLRTPMAWPAPPAIRSPGASKHETISRWVLPSDKNSKTLSARTATDSMGSLLLKRFLLTVLAMYLRRHRERNSYRHPHTSLLGKLQLTPECGVGEGSRP
jgi:hypothetical protein